jgi:hypothetical protein
MQASIGRRLLNAVALLPAYNERQDRGDVGLTRIRAIGIPK